MPFIPNIVFPEKGPFLSPETGTALFSYTLVRLLLSRVILVIV